MKTSGNPSAAKACLLALMFVSYADTYVFAAPRGGQVVSGTASFTQNGNLTVITAGNRSIINYQSFNIAPNEIVRFVQPNAGSSVLNRVTSPNPTNIFGQIQANGNVYIVNPYGVFFQNGAVINVGGLYAGAGKINDADFTAGRIHFTDLAGDVRNDGVLAADNRIVLLGANVTNSGTMTSTRGLATMVSGREVYVGERNSNVFVRANGTAAAPSAASGSVTNTGTVSARRVLLGAGDLYSTAIVNSGVLRGHDVTVNAGRGGSATVGGTLDASTGSRATGTGGNIRVLGGTVALQGAALNANGAGGGGTVRVGGDFHGGGTLAHATTTTVDAATTIHADATGAQGDGGSVVLWSDSTTYFGGSISARGGSVGGNGGSAEVSSADTLLYRGTTDLRAPVGTVGSLLLDPKNITVNGSATNNPATIVLTGNPATEAFGADGAGASITLSAGLLGTTLETSSVILQANNNITFTANVAPLAGANDLTLRAGNSISIGDPTAHTGATLTLRGAFSATFNDSGSTVANRDPGAATFSMEAASAIVAPNGVAITGGTQNQNSAGTGTLNANTGGITVQNLTTGGTTNGGTTGFITLTNNAAANAPITVNGTLTTTATGANTVGGAVTLLSSGAQNVTGDITANGKGAGAGGAVSLTTNHTNRNITAGAITTDGPAAGAGGSLTLSASGNLSAGALSSTSAGGAGGTVTLDAAGTMGLTSVTAAGGAGGAIRIGTVTAPTSISATGGLTATASTGDSGAINVVSGGSIGITGDIDTSALAGNSGAVTLTSGGGITLGGNINASAAAGNGNDVQLLVNATAQGAAGTADVNIQSIDTTTGAEGTSSGSITIGKTAASSGAPTSIVTVTLDTATATTTTGGAGSISLLSAGGVNVGVVDTHGTNVAGGNFTIRTFGAAQPAAGTANVVVTSVNASSSGAAGGTLSVGGPAGAAARPTSIMVGAFNTSGSTAAVNDGAIFLQTNGAITFLAAPNPVLLTGDTTLVAASVTPSSFNAQGHNLVLTLSGAVSVGGAANPYTNVRDFTSNGLGGTTVVGDFTTTGSQSYGNAVTLGNDATLTAGGAITFGSTLGSDATARALVLSPGAAGTFFNDVVGGGGAPLATLASTSQPTTIMGPAAGEVITTVGSQSYGAVTLDVPTTFHTTGGAGLWQAASVNGAGGSGGNGLTVNVDNGGSATLGGANHALTVLSGAGAVVFNTGTLTLNGVVGTGTTAAGATSLTTNTSGLTTLNGATVTTSGFQNYATVALGTGVTLTTTNANVTAASVAAGANDFTVTAGTGNVTLGALNNTGTVLSGSGNDTFNDGILTLNGVVGTGTGTAGANTLTAASTVQTNLNGATVTTTGAQGYGKVVLGTNVTLTTLSPTMGQGAVSFTDAVNSSAGNHFALTLTTNASDASVTFGGLVGGTDSLEDLTVNTPTTIFGGGGATTIKGSTTDGLQQYKAVSLTNDATLTGSTLSTTGVTGNGHSLTLTFSNPLTISNLFAGLNNFTVNGGGATTISTDVTTTGVQDYENAVTLTTSPTLTAGGAITFGSTLGSDATARTLTLSTTGVQTFKDTVTLGALKTTGSGDVDINGGSVTTSLAAGQNYGGAVVLGATGATPTTTLTANGAASTVVFNGAVRGKAGTAQNLSVVAGGTVTFDGAVGSAATPLASLQLTGAATVALDGGAVTTNGSLGQVYTGNVLLGSTAIPPATTLTAGTGPIQFKGQVNGAAGTSQALTLNTKGAITFGLAVGVATATTAPLASLTTSNTGTVNVDGGSVTTQGAAGQSYGGPVVLGGAGTATTFTATGGGPVTFVSTVNGAQDLTVDAGGLTTFENTVGSTMTPLLSVTVTGDTAITGGGAVTTANAQGYTGSLSLGVGTTLSAGGAVTAGSLAGNGNDLSVTAASSSFGAITSGGNLTFADGTGTALFTGSVAALSLTRTGTGLTELSSGAAATPTTVGTTLGQSYGGPLQLDVNTTLTDTGSSAITFSGAVDGSGTGTQTLAVVTGGTTTFGASVGGANPLGSLTIGNVAVNGGTTLFGAVGGTLTALNVTTVNNGAANGGGVQTYQNAVQLNVPAVTLQSNTGTAAGGDITFVSTVESFDTTQRTLNVNTVGNEIFRGLVGGGGRPLLGLVTDGAGPVGGQTQFNMSLAGKAPGVAGVRVGTGGVTVNDQAVFNVAGSLSNKLPTELGGTTGNHPSVFSDGPQSYNDLLAPALEQADTVLKGTTLMLADGINASPAVGTNDSLTLDFSGGPVRVSGLISGVNNFANVGSGTLSGTEIDGNFQTVGFQYYGNATTLTADATLLSSGGQTIRFDGTLNGPHNLAINTAGDEIFNTNALVGNTAPLTSLTIDGGIAPNQGTATFGMDATGSPAGTAGVTVGAGGLVVHDAVTFSVAGTPTSVRSGGVQTYLGLATLGANTVLANTAVSDITFGSSVNGTFDLTLNSPGNEVFHGQVGSSAPLLSLTTDAAGSAGGSTIFALTVPPGTSPQSVITRNNVAPGGPAAGGQTYNDAVVISQATVLSSTFGGPATTGGAVTFKGTVDSAGAPVDLTVLAGVGQTVFAANTTVNAAGLNIGGAQVTFDGSVGSSHPLNVLTVGSNGSLFGTTPTIDINNNGFVTSLGQTYADNVILSADTVLTVNGTQNIAFGGTVNGDGVLLRSLSLNTGGSVTFGGLIGNVSALRGLQSNTTAGTAFNMVITGGAAGVNVGAGGVTITGPTIFNATGSTLTSLAQPTIRSTGPITFNGAVALNQNTSLYNSLPASSPGLDIMFNGPVDGGVGLALNTAGNETFNTNAVVGGTTPLANFTSDALVTPGGQTEFLMNVASAPSGVAGIRVGAGGLLIKDGVAFGVGGSTLANPSVLVFNGGTQAYAGTATLLAGTVLVGDASGGIPAGGIYNGGGAIGFGQTVAGNGAAPNLTLRTGVGQTTFLGSVNVGAVQVTGAQVTFNAAVTGLGALVISPNGGTTGKIDVNGPSILTNAGGQTYDSPLTLSTSTKLSDSGGGDITLGSTVNGAFGLVVSTAGNMLFDGAVGGMTALQSLTVTGGGNTYLNGGSVTTAPVGGAFGSQTYDNHVFLGLNTTLNAPTGSDGKIVFNGAIDSNGVAKSLTINANFLQLNGAVGANSPLLSLAVTGDGTTLLNAGSVTTTAFQSYGSLLGTTVSTVTQLNAGTDIRFPTALDGAANPANSTLTLTANGQITFTGAVGASLPLTRLTANGGAILVNGGSVNTNLDQTYNGPLTLGAATAFQSLQGGNVVFGGSLDGVYDVAVNTAGTTAFNGLVGGTNPLLSLTTNAGGTTQFNMDAGTAGANRGGVNVAGAVTINDAVVINVANSSAAHPSVLTVTGMQVYNGAASLAADAVLAAGGNADIAFNSTLDGTFNLAINTGGATIFNGFVGGTNPLLSLTTDAGGTTQINGGGITTAATNGAQTYNDAILLGTDTGLSSRVQGSGAASGDIVFNSTVDGAFALRINTGGRTIFNGLVGSGAPLAALAINSAANPGAGTQFNMTVGVAPAGVLVNGAVAVYDPVNFNVAGSSLTQPGVLTLGNGEQTYNGVVTLATNTVLVSASALPAAGGSFAGGGEIVFGSPAGIASAGGDNLLVRSGVGATTFASSINVASLDLGGARATFNGPVSLTGLLSVEPNGGLAGGTIVLGGGSLTTAGAQVYNTAVILGADTVLTSLNTAGDGGNIVFASTVDSDGLAARALTLNTPGDEVFDGIVGGTSALASLTTDAMGAVGGSARFNMSLDGAAVGIAGLRTTGAVTINDAAVFNVTGSSLDPNDHPGVASGTDQTYNGPATLLQDTALLSTGSAIVFNATVDGGVGLALTAADGEAFNGIVGGTSALASLTTAGGTTSFNLDLTRTPDAPAGVRVSGALTLNAAVLFNVAGSSTARPGVLTLGPAAQSYNGAATLLQNTVLTGGGKGDLVFASTVDGNHALTLNTGGITFLGGLVGGIVPVASLTTDAPGSTAINGRGVITAGAQAYGDIVTLGADTTLASRNAGAISFANTLDGAFALTINTGGQTVFNNAVGDATPLVSLTTDQPGETVLSGGDVTTTDFQIYGDQVTLLAQSSKLTSLNTAGNGGAITFMQTVDNPHTLLVFTSGNTVFNGLVGSRAPLELLVTDGPGTTFLNGGGVTTTGAQQYMDAVRLGANTLLVSNGGGGVAFSQTLDGAFALTVSTSGSTFFGGLVGSAAPLFSLTVGLPGRTFISGGGVTTTGPQTYGNPVTLGADTVLNAADEVGFTSTVDGAFALKVNAPGATIFQGAVGGGTPLASLTTDAPGATVINGGAVTTTGFQSYGDAVALGRNTSLTSVGTADGGQDITLGQTVDGAVALQVSTGGRTVFDGFVGGGVPLLSVTTGPAGSTVYQGGGATTTGFQTYGNPVTLLGDATLTSLNTAGDGGAVTFGQTVDGAFGLTVNTSGNTSFGGFVGGNTPLASLTTDAPGTVTFQGGGVTTTGLQSYGDAAILAVAGTTTFTSVGGGIAFGQTVDGDTPNANALVLDAAGLTSLGGNVGASVPLLSLTATGTLFIGGESVTTLRNQLYGGALSLNPGDGADTRLASNAGNVRFQGDVTAADGLLVEAHRITAERDITAAGNLDLEAGFGGVPNDGSSPLLILGGKNYVSTGGNILFNAQDYAGPQTSDRNATIVLTSSDKVLIQGRNFTMGYLQKALSLGSVDIEVARGVATVGDVAARNNLRINASEIDLLSRPAIPSGGGRPDDGLNFVADNSIDFGSARIVFTGSTNPTATFITLNGNTVIQRVAGISFFKDPNLDSQFRQFSNDFSAGGFTQISNEIQPVGGGSQALDTAAALSGALPDQKPLDVAVDITITASQMEELKKLGIHPRLAQKSERRATGSKRALFAQLVDGQDAENYGRLQPIKGGISRLEPSDYVVVVDRMGEREVSSILQSFEGLYGKNKEKAPEIGAAFQTAFNDYTVQKQTADPTGFSPFLESQHGKYPAVDKATRSFDDLFGHIEHLGLTDKEVFKSEEHIVSDLGVSGVSPADMVKVINSLRRKLPPEQKAPSTKAPPSAPAANPAPNATAPAQPDKKKEPPLKTAGQEKKDAPAKTAHRAPSLPADRRPARHGLTANQP